MNNTEQTKNDPIMGIVTECGETNIMDNYNKTNQNLSLDGLYGQFDEIINSLIGQDTTGAVVTVTTADGLIMTANPITLDYVVHDSNRAERNDAKQGREHVIKNDLIINKMKENRKFSKRLNSQDNKTLPRPDLVVNIINSLIRDAGAEYLVKYNRIKEEEYNFTVYGRHGSAVMSYRGSTALLVDFDTVEPILLFNVISQKIGLDYHLMESQVKKT